MKSRFLLSVLALLFIAAADGSRNDETKKDLQRLQGTWAFVSVEENGVKKPQRDLKGMENRINWTFAGNVLFRNLASDKAKGGFRIDASKQPKEIDFFDYAGKGVTARGIYAFDGEQLKICVGNPKSGERPQTFATQPKSGQVNFLMKRHVIVIEDS
jgi:uncharacterized protein (TIGR03067 family)